MQLLQQMIGDLAGEGFVESQGQFTLDVEAARRRMADFTLADPYQWVLKMVQAASLLDCQHISITTGAGELGLRFEGMKVSLEEFQQCLQALTLDGAHGTRQVGLNHLAQALHALQRRTGKRTLLRAAQPGLCYALEGETVLTRPTDSRWRAEPMITLVLQRSWNWLQREWPEVEWLRRRCYAAPCRLVCNLQPWSKSLDPVRPGTSFFSMLFQYARYEMQLLVGPSSRGTPWSRQRPVVDSPGAETALFCCDSKLKVFAPVRLWDFNGEIEGAVSVPDPPVKEGRLFVWLDGVLSEPVSLPGLSCDALVGREGLTCDLSGLRMVENEALREKVEWVRVALERLHKIRKRSR